MPLVRLATERGVNLVIGTTGLSTDDIKEIDRLAKAKGVGVVIAPNFALGAVLMMHLAKIAGKYLDYAEIIELHHERKPMRLREPPYPQLKPWLKPGVSHLPPRNRVRNQIVGESRLKVSLFTACVCQDC